MDNGDVVGSDLEDLPTDRYEAWEKIRSQLPGVFFEVVKAQNLEKEIRLSQPLLQGQFRFTPYTQLEQLSREISHLDETLAKERDLTLTKQTQEFEKRWEIAQQRNQDLENILLKFAEYYSSLQSKLQKDAARRVSYLNETEEDERTIRRLKKELEFLKKVKTVLTTRKEVCSTYKTYLEKCVEEHNNAQEEETEKFQNGTLSIIEKYDVLKSTRQEGMENVLKNIEESVKLSTEERREKELSIIENLTYYSHTTKLEDYNERLDTHVGKLNETLVKVKGEKKCEILEKERMKMAIYTIYRNVAKEMKQQDRLRLPELERQLRFINKFMGELDKVRNRTTEFLGEGSTLVHPSQRSVVLYNNDWGSVYGSGGESS